MTTPVTPPIRFTSPQDVVKALDHAISQKSGLVHRFGESLMGLLEDQVVTEDEFVKVATSNQTITAPNAQNMFRQVVLRFGEEIEAGEVDSFIKVLRYPTANRPEWINDAEAAWLDVNGLIPVATYEGNTVTIKLKKPGLSAEDILKTFNPYAVWNQTSLVETSFEGELDGKQYLFTGTKYGLFTPTVTTFVVEQDEDLLLITWEKADDATARRFLKANRSRLDDVMQEAGMTGTTVDEYIEDIMNNHGNVVNVTGRHEYHFAEGYYQYSQTVQLGKVLQKVVNFAGVDSIKNSALKIAYLTIGEIDRAGERGKTGESLVAMDGSDIRAGK